MNDFIENQSVLSTKYITYVELLGCFVPILPKSGQFSINVFEKVSVVTKIIGVQSLIVLSM